MLTPSSVSAVMRAAASGQSPAEGDVRLRQTKKTPKPTPAARASTTAHTGSRGSRRRAACSCSLPEAPMTITATHPYSDAEPGQAARPLSECDTDDDREAGRDHSRHRCHGGHHAVGQGTEEDQQTDAA